MCLVEALADPWGAEDNYGGTRVWFGLEDHTDHNPARDLDIDRVDASRGSVAECWTPRECRQGEHSSLAGRRLVCRWVHRD